MQQGSYAADEIVARLRGETVAAFHYHNKGNLAVIGTGGRSGGFRDVPASTGVVAWLLWLFVHLMYLVGFQNRLLVFLRWGFQY